MDLGDKIKQYREAKGVSQFDLELEIATSNGRISKIENGKINPDKETIVAIAKALQLDSLETASLFGIDVPDVYNLIDDLCEVMVEKKLAGVIDKVVNGLVFKLGFIASAIFLVEKERIYMRGLTFTNISQRAVTVVTKPLDELFIPLHHPINLTAKVIDSGLETITDKTAAYIVPLVDTPTANKIQEITGDKSVIIFPLAVGNSAFGAIAFVKKVQSDFAGEKKNLSAISKLIAAAIYRTKV